jgi:hypothetical protein
MKTKYTFLLSLTFLISILVSCSEPPPIDGWRYPNKSDLIAIPGNDGWENDNPQRPPVPYHFSADLNGDGLSDDAWMLISTYKNFKDSKWGIFVFFNQNAGPPIIVEYGRDSYWEYRQGYPNAYQSYYIEEFPCGEYSGVAITWAEVDSEGICWDKKTSSLVPAYGYSH